MMMNTGEKLASIHVKIRAIHDRLDGAERNLEYSKCGGEDAESCATYTADLETANVNPTKMGGSTFRAKLGSCSKQALEMLRRRLSGIRQVVQRQSFYAHCFKLLTLFVVALVHLVYLHPFLEMFSVLEDYSANVNTKLQVEPRQAFYAHETNVLKSQMEALTDYKKNIWISVGVMCVALSTSCFFLFILPVTKIRKFHVALVGAIDLVAFATCLSFSQLGLLVSAESLMNAIQCTILPREKLHFCSQLILNSILPVVLLKYLLILCILTLAYLLTAYIIQWCIKHVFPPHCNVTDCCCCSKYSNDSCSCCGCKTDIKKYKPVSASKSSELSCGGCCNNIKYQNLYCGRQKVWRTQREFNRKTYLPTVLYPEFRPEVSAPELSVVLPAQVASLLTGAVETLPPKCSSPILLQEEEPSRLNPSPVIARLLFSTECSCYVSTIFHNEIFHNGSLVSHKHTCEFVNTLNTRQNGQGAHPKLNKLIKRIWNNLYGKRRLNATDNPFSARLNDDDLIQFDLSDNLGNASKEQFGDLNINEHTTNDLSDDTGPTNNQENGAISSSNSHLSNEDKILPSDLAKLAITDDLAENSIAEDNQANHNENQQDTVEIHPKGKPANDQNHLPFHRHNKLKDEKPAVTDSSPSQLVPENSQQQLLKKKILTSTPYKIMKRRQTTRTKHEKLFEAQPDKGSQKKKVLDYHLSGQPGGYAWKRSSKRRSSTVNKESILKKHLTFTILNKII
uniref:Uncharacterized protein n=1 Tax=Ditylenchus dipsaci TaxID=166011 RepID=A0A915D874_9BILA